MESKSKLRNLKFSALVVAVAASITLSLVVILLQYRPPQEPGPEEATAYFSLVPISDVPDVAYNVTAQDLEAFPVIARVFRCHEEPASCPGLSINTIGPFTFYTIPVNDEESRPAWDYLSERFEALAPGPSSGLGITLQYESRFFYFGLIHVRLDRGLRQIGSQDIILAYYPSYLGPLVR